MGGREARQPEQDYDLRAKYNKKKEKARRAIRLERGKRLAERFIDPSSYPVCLSIPSPAVTDNARPLPNLRR